MKLNIGCGHDYREGWRNVDISTDIKVDASYDIRNGIPEKDNSCEEIYCSGVLEQILENEAFRDVLNDLWRICKSEGILRIIVPSARYIIAFRDPFDCRHFTEETWLYVSCGSKYYTRYGSIYGFKPWHIGSLKTSPDGIMSLEISPVKVSCNQTHNFEV
jgi:hypothetical protein